VPWRADESSSLQRPARVLRLDQFGHVNGSAMAAPVTSRTEPLARRWNDGGSSISGFGDVVGTHVARGLRGSSNTLCVGGYEAMKLRNCLFATSLLAATACGGTDGTQFEEGSGTAPAPEDVGTTSEALTGSRPLLVVLLRPHRCHAARAQQGLV